MPRCAPQRHPDADLAGAAGDVVRHAAVETHAGVRQRQDREATAQLGKRDLLVDLIVRSMSAVWVHNQGYPQPDQMVYALRTSGDRTNTGYYATGGLSLVRPPWRAFLDSPTIGAAGEPGRSRSSISRPVRIGICIVVK